MNVMLDLETMGTGPNAAIIQIGAIAFSDTRLSGWTFERNVSLQSSLIAGGTIDQRTISWWQDRPASTRAALELNVGPLATVLEEFTQWYSGLTPEGSKIAMLWSHGAAFDVPILESAYRSCTMKVPWNYRTVRDTRTLFALAEVLSGWKWARTAPTAHTALADATAQALAVIYALAALKGTPPPPSGHTAVAHGLCVR